jgi:hypothetical protein
VARHGGAKEKKSAAEDSAQTHAPRPQSATRPPLVTGKRVQAFPSAELGALRDAPGGGGGGSSSSSSSGSSGDNSHKSHKSNNNNNGAQGEAPGVPHGDEVEKAEAADLADEARAQQSGLPIEVDAALRAVRRDQQQNNAALMQMLQTAMARIEEIARAKEEPPRTPPPRARSLT